jgi:phosphoribosyl-AMP cyclohydrolase
MDTVLKLDANGLIPAIIQDLETRQVLMVGWMNQASIKITSDTGLVTFWSRSRQKLWTKGETSGNYLHVQKMLIDCDRDTILVLVKADGPTCHTGKTSCFFTEFTPIS